MGGIVYVCLVLCLTLSIPMDNLFILYFTLSIPWDRCLVLTAKFWYKRPLNLAQPLSYMSLSRTTTQFKMAVPSLQLQCLYSVAGRLEEYSSQTLSLLPTSLRCQLLPCLPIVDICRLERDPAFMHGIHNPAEEVWSNVNIGSIGKKIVKPEKCGITFGDLHTAKDILLNDVVNIFLTRTEAGEIQWHFKIITCYLYGVCIKEDMYGVAIASFKEQTPVESSGVRRWAVPQRYVSEAELASVSEMWKRFIHSCQWFPITMCVGPTPRPGIRFEVLQQLLLCVVEVNIFSHEFTRPYRPPAIMAYIMQAIVKAGKMNTLGIASVWLVIPLVVALTIDNSSYSGLTTLDLSDDGFSSTPSALEDLVQLIHCQKQLESITLGLIRLERKGYGDIGIIFNYLPHFVSRPCFKLLHVEHSNIPRNSLESIVCAFLSSPTCHDQHLEFDCCEIIDNCFRTLSSECRYKEICLYQGEKVCIAGEHKSLTVPAGEPLFPLHWLAVDYPGLRLQRLDLQLFLPYVTEDQVPKIESTCETLNLFSRSADTLCISFIDYINHPCHQTVCNILKNPILSELRLKFNRYFKPYDYTDINILSVMSTSIEKAVSLRQIGFTRWPYSNSNFNESVPQFFSALFSMPREQLATITLDLEGMHNGAIGVVFQAWKEKAGGQKIGTVITHSQDPENLQVQQMSIEIEHKPQHSDYSDLKYASIDFSKMKYIMARLGMMDQCNTNE